MKDRVSWKVVAFGVVMLLEYALVARTSAANDLRTQKDAWYTGFPSQPPWNDKEQNQIHKQRLLPVPDAHLDEAIALLAHAEVIEIDLPKARQMLDKPHLVPDKLLKLAMSEAKAEADKREGEAKDPFFATHAKMFLEDAQKYRSSAKAAEELLGKTKPYLVRAVVLWEGTGSFDAYWKDSSLWIHHGCLGRTAAPMKRRPLVIFLDKKPKSVYNNVSMAE